MLQGICIQVEIAASSERNESVVEVEPRTTDVAVERLFDNERGVRWEKQRDKACSGKTKSRMKRVRPTVKQPSS